MKLLQHPSPNHGARPATIDVDTVVLHATADADTMQSVNWCCTPAPKNPKPVSYHAIVDRDGTVFQLVDPRRRAWHAGVSRHLGRDNVNDFSVGLSFANKNDGVEKYTDAQYAAGAALVASWMRQFPLITLERITTHAEIRDAWRKNHPEAEIKTDPVRFDLTRFKTLVALEYTEAAAKAAAPTP
jgi:N-acetylmuramoyl-L-alanine amidase